MNMNELERKGVELEKQLRDCEEGEYVFLCVKSVLNWSFFYKMCVLGANYRK